MDQKVQKERLALINNNIKVDDMYFAHYHSDALRGFKQHLLIKTANLDNKEFIAMVNDAKGTYIIDAVLSVAMARQFKDKFHEVFDVTADHLAFRTTTQTSEHLNDVVFYFKKIA